MDGVYEAWYDWIDFWTGEMVRKCDALAYL